VASLWELPPGLRARLKLTVSGAYSALDLREGGAPLQAALRKESLRRHHKKLSKLGALRLRHLEDPDEIERHLPGFFRMHVARRALAGDRSLFCREEDRAFYKAMVRELDPRGALRFAVLELDGKPIAYHVGFESAGKFLWYKPAFDVTYWDYSPGEVLLKGLLEYVAERDLEEFDFTSGEEAFKSRFANRVRTQYMLHFFPARARGRVYHLGLVAKDYLKKQPRAFEALRTAVRGVRGWGARGGRALRRHGLARSVGKLLRAAWRAGVHACDEVLVYCHEGPPDPRWPTGPGDELEVRPGTLLELAALSADHPEFLDAGRLHTARERLKRGDRLHIARIGGEMVHLAWTAVRSDIQAVPEVGPGCRVELDEPAPVIFDCWTPPTFRGRDIYPRVLRALTLEALRQHRRVWIYCLRANVASSRGILKAGFRLRYRMGRTQWFGRVVRTWVEPELPQSGAVDTPVRTRV
jgi:hypothetical protein